MSKTPTRTQLRKQFDLYYLVRDKGNIDCPVKGLEEFGLEESGVREFCEKHGVKLTIRTSPPTSARPNPPIISYRFSFSFAGAVLKTAVLDDVDDATGPTQQFANGLGILTTPHRKKE